MKEAPTKEGMQSWIEGLSEQTLYDMLEYKEPRLIVVPPVLTTQLLEMIGGKNHWPEGWDDVKAPKWKFGVTDGVEDLDFDQTIFYLNPNAPKNKRTKRTNEQMVLEYKRRLQAKGQDLMPQYAYVPAATTVMAEEGKVLDRKNCTVFEKRAKMLYAPCADFDHDRMVRLGSLYLPYSDKGLRCRPWVEGR